MMRGQAGIPIKFDTIDLFVLGPSKNNLEALRSTWKAWIDENKKQISDLYQGLIADEEQLGTVVPRLVANPITANLGQGLSSITEPNLASLMFLAEEDNQTILFTGDGESGEILRGLEHHGKLAPNEQIHFTCLNLIIICP